MKQWEIIKTIVGSFISVYAIQGGWQFAKNQGRKEALDEMKKKPYIKNGIDGEPVAVVIDGQEYNLQFTPVEK